MEPNTGRVTICDGGGWVLFFPIMAWRLALMMHGMEGHSSGLF
jgi:hypothetical protein